MAPNLRSAAEHGSRCFPTALLGKPSFPNRKISRADSLAAAASVYRVNNTVIVALPLFETLPQPVPLPNTGALPTMITRTLPIPIHLHDRIAFGSYAQAASSGGCGSPRISPVHRILNEAQYGAFSTHFRGLRSNSVGGPKMTQQRYFYRENPDKTVVAICPWCFMTAATASNEADLEYLESLHQCPTEAFVAGDGHSHRSNSSD
jgi:hypothetical protein